MTFEKEPVVASGISTFSEVVDGACKKLMDQQIKHSIRRIQRMEQKVTDIEKELDTFLNMRSFACGKDGSL